MARKHAYLVLASNAKGATEYLAGKAETCEAAIAVSDKVRAEGNGYGALPIRVRVLECRIVHEWKEPKVAHER